MVSESLVWKKSTFSAAADCVEMAVAQDRSVHVRDSKNPGGPVLRFTPSEWSAFLHGVRAGEFDLA